jgi:hypothetical protein
MNPAARGSYADKVGSDKQPKDTRQENSHLSDGEALRECL